ncbi:MAG: hypothetical protein AB7O57_15280 [Hyphomicrobiaceae bacterium]
MTTWNPKEVDVNAIGLDDCVKEIGRECGLRANVYVKWIESGKMQPAAATAQLGGMLLGYQLLRSMIKSGVATTQEVATMLKAWARIKEKGGLARLGNAYKVLEMIEGGADLSAVHAVVQAFPGATVSGVADRPSQGGDLGPGDLAEAA